MSYSALKQIIDQNITTNGRMDITGAKLNSVLKEMVTSLGESGFQFVAKANPTDNPGTPEQKVWYLASTAGTYTNFGNIQVAEGEVVILTYDGSWHKIVTGAATAAEVTQLGQEVNMININTNGLKASKNLVAGTTYWLNIPGVFKAGDVLDITITLGSTVALTVDGFILFIDNVNTHIDLAKNATTRVTLPTDGSVIQCYLYGNRITTGGTCDVQVIAPYSKIELGISELRGTDTQIINYLGSSFSEGTPSVDSEKAGYYINNYGQLSSNVNYNVYQGVTLPAKTKIVFNSYGAAGVVCALSSYKSGSGLSTRYNILVMCDSTINKTYEYSNFSNDAIVVYICSERNTPISYSLFGLGIYLEIGDLSKLQTLEKGNLVGAINEIASGGTANPVDYNGGDIGVFKKGLCIGDSLTAGTFNYYAGGSNLNYLDDPDYSYPAKLSEMLGIEITNLGQGGVTSDEWYTSHQNDDLSGYDFAIIQLGVNDYSRYGGWTQASIDGFTDIITKLQTENNNIKIFVATIIPATSYGGRAAISQGIRDLVEDLNDPNVILIDMAVYSRVGSDSAYNCGHLSAYGYWLIAKEYRNYISWYINNNKSVFQQVQFIGTSYYYQN